MAFRHTSSNTAPSGQTEFEILKARHRFLRDDEEGTHGHATDAGPSSITSAPPNDWDEQLALKYYSSLYREFAICDLKHFKSGNFALRWRTEPEVLSGTGESSCANSRCQFHDTLTPRSLPRDNPPPQLTTLELPFAYEEQGAHKAALVKVVLCPGCVRKLMWKRRKEKEGRDRTGRDEDQSEEAENDHVREERDSDRREQKQDSDKKRPHASTDGLKISGGSDGSGRKLHRRRSRSRERHRRPDEGTVDSYMRQRT
ncbi:folate-sensitive fragile site protein Fra10Ac1-domain-containing protein [Coprinopsis sp. MPI-PUGE-AT-0042]|nr:folate-sensitive fragile site protein Fra10Ac1-domain-containing protein [Coprinopsis sp. MPI-PUGE-AT-0042]